MKPFVKFTFISSVTIGAASVIAGLVISFIYGFSSVIGRILIVIGLISLFTEIWLFKKGK